MHKSISISLIACLMASLTCGCTSAAQTIEIHAQDTRYVGDPIDIVVSGLPPQTEVDLHARRVLKNHYAPGAPTQTYVSSARFVVDENGLIDTTTSAAISGSYEGVDPNGLFWSMRPLGDETVDADPRIELEAKINGETVTSTAFDVLDKPENYSVQEIPTLPGSYFAANPEPGEHPVIIIVDGADDLGVSRETVMPQLVAQGYSVLHFATFEIIFGPSEPTVKDLPTRYVDIPIDRLQDVWDWLAEQPGVDEHRIGLYGFSRNGAYVLLAATRFDWVDAVAAIAPSDVVWEGWGDGIRLGTTSSYSWEGEPFAYVPYSDNWFRETAKIGRGQPARLRTPMDEGRWANPERVAAARIPIEQYSGALLVAGGEQDNMWSAGHMVQNIAERRAEAGLETELRVFPDAGHTLIGDGQNPVILLFEDEEMRSAQAKAQRSTWRATLELFDSALKNTGNH